MTDDQEKKIEELYPNVLEDVRKTHPDVVTAFTHECERFEGHIGDTMAPSLRLVSFLFFIAGLKNGLAEAHAIIKRCSGKELTASFDNEGDWVEPFSDPFYSENDW